MAGSAHPEHAPGTCTRIICEAISPYRLDPRGKAQRRATEALLVGRFLVAIAARRSRANSFRMAAHRLSVFWFQCGRAVVVRRIHSLRATTTRTDARLHNNVRAHGPVPWFPPHSVRRLRVAHCPRLFLCRFLGIPHAGGLLELSTKN